MLLVLIVVFISTISTVYFSRENTKELKKLLETNINNTKVFAEHSYSNTLWTYNLEAISSQTKAMLENPDIIAINVFSDGRFISGFKKNRDMQITKLKLPYIIKDKKIVSIADEYEKILNDNGWKTTDNKKPNVFTVEKEDHKAVIVPSEDKINTNLFIFSK